MDEDTGPSMIVATTNVPKMLDRAILRRFDFVLMYGLPAAKAIQKAMPRRLLGFDTTEIYWTMVTEQAQGLSSADVIQASLDAARRAVLDSKEKILLGDLLNSIRRRKELQSLGVEIGKSNPSSFHSQ